MNKSLASADDLTGLTHLEAARLLKLIGPNLIKSKKYGHFFRIAKELFTEPMLLLLELACGLYLLLGEKEEAVMMLCGIGIMILLSLYQQVKSDRATEALNELTAHRVNVIRQGDEQAISATDLVPGDLMILDEGMNVPADAIILQQHDLTVNEAAITGESSPVEKDEASAMIFTGTKINTGSCLAKVTATGSHTAFGKTMTDIDKYDGSKSLLQQQINSFVKRLALFGFIGFIIIFFLNFLHDHAVAQSLLFALTLAMSVIPEEIPVAFSSFMALGSFRMSKTGIICRKPMVIENLGAVNVFCLDKTGTITENSMEVKMLWDASDKKLIILDDQDPPMSTALLGNAVLASEEKPFDVMEQAIIKAYSSCYGTMNPYPGIKIFEYPLEGKPPMTTHIYSASGSNMVAGKGAPERILKICKINEPEYHEILQQVVMMAETGYRVIGVASATWPDENFPDEQNDFNWKFEGLIALYDPPKLSMAKVIADLYAAGITVKILTGDHAATAINIADRIGVHDSQTYATGEAIMRSEGAELQQLVNSNTIFARMFPEAKLKVIRQLKDQGDIVAMTGDGVNDGLALKASSIGIAMGKRGTATARQAADLVLTTDEPQLIIQAIKEGRKIFQNLKKAMRYIISIHVPILLIAVVPVVMQWKIANIFTPIHIIFLELIMGPTCSVFFEREPAEANCLLQRPRKVSASLFTDAEIQLSITQGLIIATGSLSLYYYFMYQGGSPEFIRTIVMVTLLAGNLFLTFINRSFEATILETSRYKNPFALLIIITSVAFMMLMLLNVSVRDIFKMSEISGPQFLLCIGVAMSCTGWVEVYKKIARR